MSKRCCAQHCFNSTIYNKNISYFSFPKHKIFAEQWADLAGRSDLKEKPLSRIIKYFLCSEHFTANSFLDKEKKQKLKRDLPHSIALPSIFKNNLHEALQIVNPKQSIEVHNIIILDGNGRNKTKLSYVHNKAVPNEKASDSCSQASSVDFEKQNKPILVTNVEVLENIENKQQLQSPCAEDQEHEQISEPFYEASAPLQKCRLCFKELQSDEAGIQIGESQHLQEFISRVMKDKITIGDKFSQVVCKNCENNSLLCLIIIQQMDATQEKLTSSTEVLMTA